MITVHSICLIKNVLTQLKRVKRRGKKKVPKKVIAPQIETIHEVDEINEESFQDGQATQEMTK